MNDFDPDAFLAQSHQPAMATPQEHPADVSGFDPDQFIEDANEEQYGGIGQQVKAGVEGVASGVLGPLAPLAETKILGVKPEDIRGRQETNPVTHGAGVGLGLVGGALLGTGEARVMAGAGKLAQEAVGLANVGEATSLGHRIGSAAVQQAAEMAVLSSGDEVAKRILQDPDASAESAISNVGLSAALGGAGGAFFSGAVSPLWDATAGPKVSELLHLVKNRVNGGANLIMPEAREQAIKTLGVEADPLIRAAMSDDIKARAFLGDLKRGENATVQEALSKFHTDASEQVANSLKLNADDVLHYDANAVGHDVRDTFTKELKQKYDPISAKYAKKDAEAALISVSDDARLAHRDQLLERGMTSVGTDSPYYKLYDQYSDRVLAKDTIGGLDQITAEINKSVRTFGKDFNEVSALNDIKASINDFKEAQISQMAAKAESEGVQGAKSAAKDLLAERNQVNADYRDFAKTTDELTNHLGVGDFRGTGTLLSKLADKISPEDLLKKFSMRNNADFIPFLQKNFPETFEKVIANERQQLIKPAVLSAAKKGDNAIDINKLSDIIQKNMAERSAYVQSIVPKEALDKIDAAKTLINAIPTVKDSGTPAGLVKLMGHIPGSALAAVGWMTGHNPLVGGVLGEMAMKAGRALPEAYKLGYLKFLGSSQPIESAAFKSMVDFFHATYKAENLLSKGVQNLFKGGQQVIASNALPNDKDREKLDKMVVKGLTNPDDIMRSQMDSKVGHYLPEHQAALSKTATGALQYLQSIKPHGFKPGPLDKEIPPTKEAEARYNRALDIAQQPAIVLQHIKNGTLQTSDIQDLHQMYPGLYKVMSEKISHQMVSAQADGEAIPYKTRISMSMFLQQPLDLSMQPTSIQAAQFSMHLKQQPGQGSQQNQSKGKPSAIKGKTNKMYMTPGQTAEADRGDRS